MAIKLNAGFRVIAAFCGVPPGPGDLPAKPPGTSCVATIYRAFERASFASVDEEPDTPCPLTVVQAAGGASETVDISWALRQREVAPFPLGGRL
jgi:hypothetical protein